MKAFISALILMVLTLGASAVQANHDHSSTTHLKFANGTVHAHMTWVIGPIVSNESALRIEWMSGVTHSAAEPPGDFKVVLWMPGMGHGSSPTKIQQAHDESGQPLVGVYDVTEIYFIMGGKWDVNLSLELPDGTVETQTVQVQIGSKHQH